MIAAIIQARMGSTRLPGKVMKEIDGLPMLHYQVNRVSRAERLDKVIVATSTLPQDNIIFDYCCRNDIEVYRGSESDVLARYHACAQNVKADVIVRLTADCPLVDPRVIDRVVELFLTSGVDYAANTVPPESRSFPDGSDVEIFSLSALERAHEEADAPEDREHVTFYFWRTDHGFKTAQLENDQDWSEYRFTVDYPEDFEVVSLIDRQLKISGKFGHLPEIIDILYANSDINKKNDQFGFGIGWSDNGRGNV